MHFNKICRIFLRGRLLIPSQLKELRGPVVPQDPLQVLGNTADGENPLQGILGQLLGQTPEQQKASIEAASKGANDLSGLVRHRKKPAPEASGSGAEAGGDGKAKRKADELGVDGASEGEGKRAKSENP
jgi:HAT1-interacting factor 1